MTNILITDQQRRARLVERQHLGGTASNVLQTVRDLVVVNSTDPVTPVLALWARIHGFDGADLDAALYEDRTLWRLHSMRRTLFVVAADEASMLDAAVGRKIAAAERKRLLEWLASAMPAEEIDGWLAETREAVLVAVSRGKGKRTSELVDLLPALSLHIEMGKGPQKSPISTRLLHVMAVELDLVRTRPKGSWRGSQYRWDRTNSWFGESLEVLVPIEDEAQARAALAGRYLASYGPVTRDDLKWFAGWTVPQTMEALAANGAVEVDLHRREKGWVLPDDVETPEVVEAGVVTLLPGLDPTPMAYKERRFFLGPHGTDTFDETGNIGPTVWLDGKIIGGWAARDNGEVVAELLEEVGTEAAVAVSAEAARLTTWLEGAPIIPRFPSHVEKRLREAEEED
ncbi:MAG: hypothetical protein ACI867_000444 [Glaciecola sp.]|jgi:hypothetical protein